MSPTLEKKHLGLPRVQASSAISLAKPTKDALHSAMIASPLDPMLVDTVEDDCDAFGQGAWKEQRKLKHQRDANKRNALVKHDRPSKGDSPPKARQPRLPHASRDNNKGVPIGDTAGARSIPGRRKDKDVMRSPLQLSRSVPSSRSWPPDRDARDLQREPSEENLNPNWSLDDDGCLASSAPEETFLSRAAKREARTMTLFESALLFNEAGRVISHDNFHELGSSPEVGSRKSKRRVGRHKPEKKRASDNGAHLSQDELVLDLMHFLLPGVEVTKELNILFLGGSRRNGEVFDFDDDVEDNNSSSPELATRKALLDIDVLKFQASLKSLLFFKDDEPSELPPVGTPVDVLVVQFLTPQWIAKSLMRALKFDVLTQYEAFAVLLSVYNTVPTQRAVILKSTVTACLAIFDHQGLESLQASHASRQLVSMKGISAFLNAILASTEQELAENPESFGDSPQAIDETLSGICDHVADSVKLLVRCSPGKTKNSTDESNQVEKFQLGSDSVEATTYAMIGEVIHHLATFSPIHGEELLTWILRKWPQRNVQLQLFYIRFATGILVQFMLRGTMPPSDIVTKVFARLSSSIKSPHFLIAKEASSVCGNLPLMDVYLSNDQVLRESIAAALHENATHHWNERIRQMSDEYFDLLLDFA